MLLDGTLTNHLSLVNGLDSPYFSDGVDKFMLNWVSCLGYQKLSDLLEQYTGHPILSDGGIKKYVLRKAVSISELWELGRDKTEEAVLKIAVQKDINVYDKEAGEVILMMDDVGVKAQKPHKKVARIKTDAKRIDTTVVLISIEEQSGKISQEPAQTAEKIMILDSDDAIKSDNAIKDDKKGKPLYFPLTEGINKRGEVTYPIKLAIYYTLKQLYLAQNPDRQLPIVAITDGARSIRITLHELFGEDLFIILDWYHLRLKVKNLMSMIAVNKTLKELYIKDLGALLWRGKAAEALEYIAQITEVKNQDKLDELAGYIQKHQSEIIDYYTRQLAGKTIGSGRCEKANDIIVANRQKKKGMAWSRSGSKALAIVKTNQLQLNTFKNAA